MCGALLLGWLSDAQGRKPVLLLSFLGAAIGYHMASWAVGVGSIGLLLASRLPVGLAKQTVTATRAMISDITPADSSRSEALAKLFAWCSLGYAVGPLAGGLLADAAGSASPLPASICASIFVVLMPLGAWLLPETATLHAADATPQEPCVQPESIAIPQRSARRSRSPACRNASAVKALPREFRRVATSSANLPEGASAAARAGIEDKAGERLEGPPSALWAWVLLIGCTCSEAALTMLASTSLVLVSQHIGWSASRLGLYNSSWGVSSGALSLTLWPWLFRSGRLDDLSGLRIGVCSQLLLNGVMAAVLLSNDRLSGRTASSGGPIGDAVGAHAAASALWAVLPLGTVAVGMMRTLPASLLTKIAPSHRRGVVLGRLDAAGSLCRVCLPALAGLLSDRRGLWAAWAVQAGFCAVSIVLIELWAVAGTPPPLASAKVKTG